MSRPDRIQTMRSFFAARGHEVEPVMFAEAHLRAMKRSVARQMRDVGIVAAEKLDLLDAVLGDPADPVDAPVVAYVNGGRWIADCECGGAEVVDAVSRLFMCASCFNVAHGHRWRLVEIPNERTLTVLERVLLERPDRRTRNWRPSESVAELIAENVAHGLMQIGDEIVIEPSEPTEPEVVTDDLD